MKLKYNPLYSMIKYRRLLKSGSVIIEDQDSDMGVLIHQQYPHDVFLQMQISKADGSPKVGQIIFEIVFHAGTMTVDEIVEKTPRTLPYFAGLPGFCAKQFMVNHEAGTFSGRYEWETMAHVEAYIHSYAVAAMRKQSKPYPIRYRIYDKLSGEVLQDKEL